MATTTSNLRQRATAGGSFLTEQHAPERIFTPEDFTDEHRQIARTALEFVRREVMPASERIERKDWALARELLRKAGALGLTAADVPERYGGMDLDKVSSAILSECMARQASFSVTFGGQTGIGLLPIVYFGTEEQKRRYLPKLGSGEWVGAYALSESSSGSDALHARTRADLAGDGRHYLLNGEKMWITNASFADVFIVFAKVDGEKFTAFIVERNVAGLAVGAEEHKMGIRGSSTCPLVLTDCRVPVENVLGEIGKGHAIAFNILNLGRCKLGAACVGQARAALDEAIRYAGERQAFGRKIASFGLIREKLARMAAAIYASESVVYRTVGMMDAAAQGTGDSTSGAQPWMHHIEEYAVECSMVKVASSEMLDMVVDEAVQIHGGYGFVEEYAAERAYRDARVNRIFEGTNEINRLIIIAQLMKREAAGKLALVRAGKLARERIAEQQTLSAVALARQAMLVGLSAARDKFGAGLAEQQELTAALADMVIGLYAIESAGLRAQKLAGREEDAAATSLAELCTGEQMERIESAARKVLAETADLLMGAVAQSLHGWLVRAADSSVAARRQVAVRLLADGRYAVTGAG